MSHKEWDLIIRPTRSLLDINFKEIWEYRDLLKVFVKRDITAVYKQTVLGPFWFFLQPVITTFIFALVFGRIAQIPTSGIPPILFYMSGIVLWNYFSDCLIQISNTFISNANVFGKVYFPRLIVPLSVIISNLFKFLVQFLLFVAIYLVYVSSGDYSFSFNIRYVTLIPLFILIAAFLAFSIGLLISSMTVKYKDMRFLLGFGVQLFMYASPIIYPLSTLSGKLLTIAKLNPIASVIEGLRMVFFNSGVFSASMIGYSLIVTLLLLVLSLSVFYKVERSFMDTV